MSTTASKNRVVCAKCHFVGLASDADCKRPSVLREIARARLAARTSAKYFAKAKRSVARGTRKSAERSVRGRFLVTGV